MFDRYDCITSCRKYGLLDFGSSDSHFGQGAGETSYKLGGGFVDLLDLIGVVLGRAYELKRNSGSTHGKADSNNDWSRRHGGGRGADRSGDVA